MFLITPCENEFKYIQFAFKGFMKIVGFSQVLVQGSSIMVQVVICWTGVEQAVVSVVNTVSADISLT